MSSRLSPNGTAQRTGPAPRLGQALRVVFGVSAPDSVLPPGLLAVLREEEIRDQLTAIRREAPIRAMAVLLIGWISLIYLPPLFALLAVPAIFLCDQIEMRLITASLIPPARPTLQRAAIGIVYLAELIFCLPSAVLWQSEDPFCKAISVGIQSAALMRLATIRSINPVSGFAGIAAQASLIAVANSWYWIKAGRYDGLAFTSVIAVIALGYVASAIIRNHRHIRQTAVSRLSAHLASAAKSQFLAQMSHELRTPLNAIIGLGTVALLRSTDPQVQRQLDVMVQSAKGLGLVLDDVLDTAAIEQGRIRIQPRIADPVQEIGLSVLLYRQSAEMAGIDLSAEFPEPLPPRLRLDFDRLRQCISNLLSNALKHTRAGHIRVRCEFGPDDLLQITVEDTGIGIAPGSEATFFDRQAPRSKSATGNGLGLSICHAIILQMGGEITVLPSTQGARLRIRVPAEVIHEAEASPDEAAQEVDFKGKRVLVVDDIATNRLVAASYLRLFHCDPVEADGGAEALRILQSRADIDLILLDMNMPEMDGFQTLRAIRALEAQGRAGSDPAEAPAIPTTTTPVIAMTADASEHDRQDYLQAGLDGYLAKPIALDRIRAELQRVLTKRP